MVFWILEYLGAEKAKVYHGGMDDWTTAKNPMTNEARKLPAAKFTAKVRADVLASIPYESAWKDPETLTKLAEKKVDNRNGAALQDMAALKELYKGVDPKKEVVAYCQTGTRSTQTYAVLREMGYQKVRNYDDSWIIYGANPDLPANNVTYFDFVKVNTALKTLEALEKRLTALEPKK